MRRQFVILLGLAVAIGSHGQHSSPAPDDFAVLRTDRVVVHTGESERLSCSITGLGNGAQINCDSTAGSGVPLVYQVALVVGSNHVGYIVSCGGGLVRRVHCRALSAGQVLKGSVEGGKLSVGLDGKVRAYRVETSAYIGPVGARASPESSVESAA